MLKIKIKESDPAILLLFWQEHLWKEISKPLFFNHLKKIPTCNSLEEFQQHFSLLEGKVAARHTFMWLGRRALFSWEIEEKLKKGGISPSTIAQTLSDCRHKGLLNDAELLTDRILAAQRRGKSQRAIAALFSGKKGINRLLLAECLKTAMPEEVVLQKKIQKLVKRVSLDDPSVRRKCIARLARQGFSLEKVLAEMARCVYIPKVP